MNNSVHHALEGLLYGYAEFSGSTGYKKHVNALSLIISDPNPGFDQKVQNLDNWVDQNPEFQPLREYLFDILMAAFIRDEGTSEDFFDSPEWDRIEDEFAERGSELLDIITYLDECSEIQIEPSIEDFIYDYLLTDDNPDNEALTIYEPLIRHKALVDEILEDIIEETAHDDENTLGPMLQALLVYFSEPAEPEGIPVALYDIGGSSAEASAVACCLLFYHRGIEGGNNA